MPQGGHARLQGAALGVPPLHHLLTIFLSFFLHVFLIASALQFFSDSVGGLVTSARPFRISEMSPATSPVADGAPAAMAQLSTLRAASRHARCGTLNICVDHVCALRIRVTGSRDWGPGFGLGVGGSEVKSDGGEAN